MLQHGRSLQSVDARLRVSSTPALQELHRKVQRKIGEMDAIVEGRYWLVVLGLLTYSCVERQRYFMYMVRKNMIDFQETIEKTTKEEIFKAANNHTACKAKEIHLHRKIGSNEAALKALLDVIAKLREDLLVAKRDLGLSQQQAKLTLQDFGRLKIEFRRLHAISQFYSDMSSEEDDNNSKHNQSRKEEISLNDDSNESTKNQRKHLDETLKSNNRSSQSHRDKDMLQLKQRYEHERKLRRLLLHDCNEQHRKLDIIVKMIHGHRQKDSTDQEITDKLLLVIEGNEHNEVTISSSNPVNWSVLISSTNEEQENITVPKYSPSTIKQHGLKQQGAVNLAACNLPKSSGFARASPLQSTKSSINCSQVKKTGRHATSAGTIRVPILSVKQQGTRPASSPNHR